jgi:hypothetical protein
MVITRQGVYFTLVGEDDVRDYIPLHEIEHIDPKHDEEDGGLSGKTCQTPNSLVEQDFKTKSMKRVKTVSAYRFFFGFQINTSKEGYNSGRTYHIQAHSKENCENAVSMLSQYSQKAKSAVQKRTEFEKSQHFVRKIHNSVWYQTVATTLILAVNYHVMSHDYKNVFLRWSSKLQIFLFALLIMLFVHS